MYFFNFPIKKQGINPCFLCIGVVTFFIFLKALFSSLPKLGHHSDYEFSRGIAVCHHKKCPKIDIFVICDINATNYGLCLKKGSYG
jgi:hypothetical protein